MCTNYRPTARDLLAERMGVVTPSFTYPEEAWPGYAAPLLRQRNGALECVGAGFGLVPYWSRDAKIARSTYNARAETAHEKPSFRQAWARGQWGLVPMDCFYEPNYESGKAVRWRIERRDGMPFHVAALWDRWTDPATGEPLLSFSMLTLNADRHGLMQRFHRPGEEKRSIVVIDPADAEAWLAAAPRDARDLLRGFDAEAFSAAADPLPPRTRAAG
jgi:putative SOS response-associated peptidase YedK